jgi:DNA polymerase III subunit gamma/tau
VEPKFRRSSQQQLLLETLLIRFALLDRTVDVESMLREVGGGGGAGGSGRAGSLRPAASPASTRTGQSSDVPTSRGGYRSDVSDRRETPVATPRIPDGDARPTRSADVRASDARAAGVSSAEPRVGAAYAADSRSAGAPGGTVVSAVAAPNVTGDVAVAERPSRPQPAPVPAAEPMPFAAPASRPGAVLAINTLVERWDEIVAAVRRERPIIGTLLEKTIPTGISASGLVTLQIEDIGGFEGLSSKTKEVTLALATQVSGISRVQLLPPESAAGGGPRRMTAESIKSESLLALRKRDPVLGAAIDELDLELLD